MGEYDIINFLRRNQGKKFSAQEIVEHMGVGGRAVFDTLKRMRETRCHKYIKFEKISRKGMRTPFFVYWWEDENNKLISDEIKPELIDKFFELERHLSKTLGKLKESSADAEKLNVFYTECKRLKTFEKYSRYHSLVKMYHDIIQEAHNLVGNL